MTATVLPFARAVHAQRRAVPPGMAPPSPGGAVAVTHPTPLTLNGHGTGTSAMHWNGRCSCGQWSAEGDSQWIRGNWAEHAEVPPLPHGIHPCPTCDRAGCERCDALGRGSWMRVYADRTDDGRATLELWFGAAGTQERVALADHTLAHDRVDSILATLAEAPGVVIRDRRGRGQ